MSEAKGSEKPANVISAIAFILCTGIFAYIGVQSWLPFLILNLGIAVTLRQIILRHHFDTIISSIVFGGAFVSSLLGFFSVVFLPSLCILGAIYYIIRQFFSFKTVPHISESIVIKEEKPRPRSTEYNDEIEENSSTNVKDL
jgi:hypothetical protein